MTIEEHLTAYLTADDALLDALVHGEVSDEYHLAAVERVRALAALQDAARRETTIHDALRAQLAQVTAERDALRAIVEGRTTPPTIEEAQTHIDAGGVFRMACGTRAFTAESMIAVDLAIEDFPGGRWWALDAQKRPCAWPVVGEVQR